MQRVGRLVAIILTCLVLVAASVYANGNVWWESLSQTQRDMYIANEAWRENGQNGGECKVWVQNLVKYVSLTHVMLPQNMSPPNDFYWQSDPYGHAFGMSIPIENVTIGQIVQMKFRSTGTPHTAIVVGKDANGVGFLASNDPLGSYTVRYRYWTFSAFKTAVSGYTVYSVR